MVLDSRLTSHYHLGPIFVIFHTGQRKDTAFVYLPPPTEEALYSRSFLPPYMSLQRRVQFKMAIIHIKSNMATNAPWLRATSYDINSDCKISVKFESYPRPGIHGKIFKYAAGCFLIGKVMSSLGRLWSFPYFESIIRLIRLINTFFRNPCQVCIHSGQNKQFEAGHDLQKICAEEIIIHKKYKKGIRVFT